MARNRNRHAAAALLLGGSLCLGGLLTGCGSSLESKLESAEDAQTIGDFRGSIPFLEEIIAEDPHHPRANYLLGLALVRTQQPSLAVWPLREAATSDSDVAAQAGLTLAGTLVVMESFEEAAEAADGVLAIEPDNQNARIVKANAMLRAADPVAALPLAEEVLADAERSELHFLALQIQSEALVELKRYPEAAETLTALHDLAGETNPEKAPLACVAIISFQQEMLEDEDAALAQLDACLSAYPDDSGVLDYALWFYDQREQSERATELLRTAVSHAPEDFELLAKLAQRLRRDGDGQEGERLLREAAELSDKPAGWLTLAHFLHTGDDRAQALEAIDRAVALSEGQEPPEELLFNRADLLIDAGRLEEAQAVADGLEQPAFKALLRGRILQEQDDLEGALQAYERGVLRWPNNANARFLAGQAAEQLGRRELARSHYREATRADAAATDAALQLARMALEEGDFTTAYELVSRHGHNRPQSAALFYVGASAALRLGRLLEADAAFRMLQDWEGQKANGLLGRAAVARASRGHEVAAGVLRGSELDLDLAENERVLRALVADLVELEEWGEAFARIDAALAARPDEAGLHGLRGRTLLEAGRTDEAALAFDRALELDPGYGPAIAGRATLLGRAGELEAAIALHDEAAAAATPEPASAYHAAQLAFAAGDPADAERRLREILERDPFQPNACNDLAWLLASEGRELGYALELALRAERLDPKHEVYDTLGSVYLRQGEARKAAAAFSKAVEARPESPLYRYQQGVALAASGQDEAARGALREALALGPFPQEAAAREELARLDGGAATP